MNIAIQVNRKYLKYAGVMLTSLCINNSEHIDLFVLNADLTKEDFNFFEDVLKEFDVAVNDIKVVIDDVVDRLPQNAEWTKEVYFKLKLPELLPVNVSKILYLDVDIIVNGSVDELYDMNFEGKDLMVAADMNNTIPLTITDKKRYEMLSRKYGDEYVYFNSGVMLMNIELLREKYSFEDYMNAIDIWNSELVAVDQDLLNYVHGGNVGYVDWNRYNLYARLAVHKMGMDYEYVKANSSIVHFMGGKPWNTKATLHFDVEQLWWDYAKHTSYYEELADEFIRTTLINPEFENLVNSTFEENGKLHELLDKCMVLLNKMN